VLHSIKSKRDKRLLNDSAEAGEKPAILTLTLTLITRPRLGPAIAALISFIAAAPATTAKRVQSFIVSICIKWHFGWLVVL
jgi:hypothetical protein